MYDLAIVVLLFGILLVLVSEKEGFKNFLIAAVVILATLGVVGAVYLGII